MATQETTTKIVNIREALENPMYGFTEGMYVEYVPDVKRKCVIKKEQGGLLDQTIKAKSLGWKVVKVYGEPYLLSTPTRDKVSLYGEEGYKNGEHILGRVARLYRNEKLGLKAEPLTEDLFWGLSLEVRKNVGRVWLATRFKTKGVYAPYSGLYVADNGGAWRDVLVIGDANQQILESACVLIKLPETAKVELIGMQLVG